LTKTRISLNSFMARAPKPYRYLDHTADLGVEVSGKTLPELLANTGRAIFETQIHGKLRTHKEKSINLQSDSLEDLFIDWCRELLYNFSVHGFIPRDYEISVEDFAIHANLRGDIYDAKRHRVRIEIKNPTYHNLAIEKIEDGFCARIIFDV
jgi:SHS2 domain-containing protein